MRSWLDVQRSILSDWIIAEIDLENITPIRVGGYNARPVSDRLGIIEGIRTQSIKGVWRWWARAILAGAMLSRNIPLPSSISDLDKEISQLLGSTEASSEFFIQLAFDKRGAAYITSDNLLNIPRIKLITRSMTKHEMEKIERYYNKLGLKLIFGSRKSVRENDKNAIMFALSSLIIALIFSGIGSITTRGFGKLSIINLETKTHVLKNEIANLKQLLDKIHQQGSEEGITNGLKELISVSLNYAANYKSLGKAGREIRVYKLPKIPTLALNCTPEVFRVETICISRRNAIRILECLGKSTMKVEWKRSLGLPITSPGKNLHTWVLGLPRYQRLTGYLPNSEKGKEIRRQSPIGFTVLKCHEGFAIILYGFLTADLSRLLTGYKNLVLKHIGFHARRRNVTSVYDDLVTRGLVSTTGRLIQIDPAMPTEEIYRVCFNEAWEFVKKIIKGGCCG